MIMTMEPLRFASPCHYALRGPNSLILVAIITSNALMLTMPAFINARECTMPCSLVIAMSFAQDPMLRAGGWPNARVLEKAKENVVVIKFIHMYPFDGEAAASSEATGFVIDAEQGFVLTNRHVAGPGPFWGWCIFHGQEEAPCRPFYIDPVHDFAVLKYEPSAVRAASVDGLKLYPYRATVGQSLLILGNNATEQISEHYGCITLAERNAPEYAEGYSDFNISYYQANINLSGGISGSPALSADGAVVGIVSGIHTDGANVCFILPSVSILKTITRLLRGHDVPRGDIRCQFLLTPLYKCRALGLGQEWEEKIQGTIAKGHDLLVAHRVLSDGPSCGHIRPGDIIIHVNKVFVCRFEEMAHVLNENVGQTVWVGLLRQNEFRVVGVQVRNLYTILERLVQLGGIFCHDLSLTQAVRYGVRAEGVYVAESREPAVIGDGGCDYMIQKVNGQAVRNMDDLISLMRTFRKGQRITLLYAHIGRLHVRSSCVVVLDAPDGGVAVVSRLAAPAGLSGTWRKTRLFLGRPLPTIAAPRPATTGSSIVHVESRSHMHVDGFAPRAARGLGVIIDGERGLVLVARSVVPHRACHVTITHGSFAESEARCWFFHPFQGYTILQYDPAAAPTCSTNISTLVLAKGVQARFMYFPRPEQIMSDDARICSVGITTPDPQRGGHLPCLPVNADLVGMDALSEVQAAQGVITDALGGIAAMWMPSVGGLRMASVLSVLARLRDRLAPALYVIPAEVERVSTHQVRNTGVSDEAMQALQGRSHVFRVKQVLSASLAEGDILLDVDGRACTEWASFDLMESHAVSVKVLRQSAEEDVELRCHRMDGFETTRCVQFCGASIQPPPHAVRYGLGGVPSEVYITHVEPGSPADFCSLPPRAFITSVDGAAVTDMDSFVGIVRRATGDCALRVTLTMLGSCDEVCVLKVHGEHYGLVEWELTDSGCIRRPPVSAVDVPENLDNGALRDDVKLDIAIHSSSFSDYWNS
ncbi:hypothetical protein PWT90_02194 [Aphanocladium album]|nr:hypothetical protein PWT90_02194 [Aphanocladium album]